MFDAENDLKDDEKVTGGETMSDGEAVEEAGLDDFKDLIEEHEEEVKSVPKSRKTNHIDDDDDGLG